MIKVNVHAAKTYFSEYLAKIKQDEKVWICKRNMSVAELRPICQKSKNFRPIGLAKNLIEISESFFEPLCEEIIKLFNGAMPTTKRSSFSREK